MGNALFRCCTSGTNVVRGNRRRRSSKILSSCGFKAPSRRRRRSIIENVSGNYQELCSGLSSENMCSPEWRDSAENQRSLRYASRSRSTSKASISVPQENPRESIGLHHIKEGRHVNCSTSFHSAISSNSPDIGSKLFNRHSYQKLPVHSPTSHSPDSSGDSPDTTRVSFDPHCNYQKLQRLSPTSRSSPLSSDSPDMARTSFNQHFYEQAHVNSPTSLSSPMSSSSPDMLRKSFNQHCNQQRHPAFLRKCQSPRRHSKTGSGKSSRRKRSGMRSSSHRTSNSKSSGRAVSWRIEDNDDKCNAMRSQSHKISKSLGIILSGRIEDNEHKGYKLLSPSHRTSNSESLGTDLKPCIEDNDYGGHCSQGFSSQSHQNTNFKSPGRAVNWCVQDNEASGKQYTSFYDGQVAVVNIISSPISRRAALALIGRQKAFANRRNVTRSSQHCRRHWKPALASILEAVSD